MPECSRVEKLNASTVIVDPITNLVQAGGGAAPAYRLLAVEGPDHDRQFLVAVEISGRRLGEGRGRTKKLAEQAAAAAAMALVSNDETILRDANE